MKRVVFVRAVLIVFVVAITYFLGLFFFNQYKSRLIEEKRVETETTLSLLADQISELLDKKIGLLTGLEDFVIDRTNREIDNDFLIFADGLQNHVEGVRNVGIAPAGILTYIYPKIGNEAAVGYNLFEDQTSSVRADVSRAIMTKEVVLSDPFELRQGGQGIAARKAIYKNGKLWGLVSVVVDISTFTEIIEPVLAQNEYEISLRNKQGDTFWGKKPVFDNNPVVKEINTVDGFWEIGGIPTSGWEFSVQRSLNIFVVLELFFIGIMAVVSYLLWKSWQKPENVRVGWRGRVEVAKPALVYFIFGSLWILFSDSVAGRLVYDPALLTKIALVKGWVFVLVTAILLYLWMVQSFDKLGRLISMLRKVQIEAKLGYYVLDIKSGFWNGSDFLKEIFGIDNDYKTDFVGWVQVVAPDERQAMTEYFQDEVLGKKRPFDKEYKIINKKTGKELWVHGLGSLEFDRFGDPIRMIGTIQDISIQKNKEITESENEIKFKYLFDDLEQGIILQNNKMEIVDINKSAGVILEIPKEQLLGKKLDDYDWRLVNEKKESIKMSEFPSNMAFKSGKSFSNVILGACLSGDNTKIKWLKINSIPKFKSGIYEPDLIVTSFTDVTLEKVHNDEINKIASFPEHNTNGIFEVDANRNIVFQNPSFVKIIKDLGVKQSAFIPEDFDNFYGELMSSTEKITRYVMLNNKIFVVTMYIPKGEVGVRFNVQELEGVKRIEDSNTDGKKDSLLVELPIK